MSIREMISDQVGDCIVERCKQRKGCSLSLKGIKLNQRIIVDCDQYIAKHQYPQRLCDYSIIVQGSDNVSVSTIEMKSGGVRANEVAEQLSNGASLVDRWLRSLTVSRFLPLLLHKGGNAIEFRVLRKAKVRFKGTDYPISTAKCGAVLKNML